MTSFARAAAFMLGVSATTLGLCAAPGTVGPFNTEIAAGGDALVSPLGAPGTTLPAPQAFTLQAWVEPTVIPARLALVAGVGTPGAGLFLALDHGVPALVTPAGIIRGNSAMPRGRWTFLAAVADKGTARLLLNGNIVASGPANIAQLPAEARLGGDGAFGGRVAGFSYTPAALSVSDLRSLAANAPDPALTVFTLSSPTWPVQVRQMAGQVTPQPAWTLPKSGAPYQKPVAKPEPKGPALAQRAPNLWSVAGWRMAEGSTMASADGAALSRAGYGSGKWYAATVPGTALTTLVDRGVYADPAYGLNNLAIPESLAHQDYWYRTEIDVPPALAGKRLALTFNGANYTAEIWVNGVRVGDMKGAFIRGRFDVTGNLLPGQRNAIAVRVSPPPHAGMTHEESLTSGVGENGGMMMLDGPTFEATEGWDWIPTVRDRNTGLWQGVDLTATGDVQIGDAQVITALPSSDNKIANITIEVPLKNLGDRPVTTELRAAFDDVSVAKTVTLAPGETVITFTPNDFPQLAVRDPKLWWPNNYGAPDLHMLHLAAGASDAKDVRFGMREVTYELSLMDRDGALRRVLVDPTQARSLHQQIVDTRHQAIRQVPRGWAYSFAAGAETSPAVTPIAGDEGLSPFLVLRVNGVRIAARGGSVGMDDFMKRVDRERQEPYFKLHRDAHMNIVRNWMGQDTGENFYALADEYGLMVFNDFWESTQDYNIEAQDVPLFLANAKDVIRRYRNHPSIVVWVPRNEGVPQPILNEGLGRLIEREDGTRLYMASSNRISLQNSGPYNWRRPEEYFTEHAKGFSVELGTPSFPTLESWKRAIPAPDLWPISDVWAYHDWHQTGNGAVAGYMKAMDAQFGAATSLEDFERKAQMLQYVSYRAILEGFNAGLWTTNSARMFWMTQPAWPSSAWQIFSSDYDTHAAFYGTKKASEPVHVQMNLPDYKVMVINNGRSPLAGATVHARVTTLDNKLVGEKSVPISAGAGLTADAFTLDLAPALANGVVLVALDVTAASGEVLSRNFYWQGRDDASYRALGTMPQVKLAATAASRADGADRVTTVDLTNPSATAAIETKLTMFGANGAQILPALFTDNYVSLLPGEVRRIDVRYPASAASGAVTVRLRGWNVVPTAVKAR
ncbi:glycosyl hydrolase 2 galactose-binding domain-containing protein [Sphingomonas crusticola]|uniref:glycosyl hydrolase 2 galactose-binding domain-containing protein n=1 Tax=Sphingomonas crusticola TaxID=1697973 RepID=UPI000E282868|nr:LamG-like jellyroll fold domain-containing protein [Sphingomonas crusticola]